MLTLTDPLPPLSDAEVRIARESVRTLGPLAARPLRVRVDGSNEIVDLPAGAVRLLVELLAEMAAGHAVTMIPIHAELTTQEAADLLGVSRPFLIEQLNSRAIPFRRVGSHRRIRFGDVKAYKLRMDAERDKALDELTAEAQRLNLGY